MRPERKQIRGASFTACKQKEEKITNIPSIIEEFPETSEQNLKITKILLKQFVWFRSKDKNGKSPSLKHQSIANHSQEYIRSS